MTKKDSPTPMSAALDLDRLLAETFIAFAEHHPLLGSTNDRARQLAAESPPLPALVIADQQTAGRGRGANRWWTGAGSLAFSLLWDPAQLGIERQRAGLVSLAVAVAIVDLLAPLLPGWEVGLHWPNDVYVGARKAAGILVEALPDGRQVVGVGLNVNNSLRDAPAELAEIAVTLADLTGQHHPLTPLLAGLLGQIEAALGQLKSSPGELAARFDAHCLQRGLMLTLECGPRLVTGRCRGIAADGALLLETAAGQERLYAGVVSRRGSC